MTNDLSTAQARADQALFTVEAYEGDLHMMLEELDGLLSKVSSRRGRRSQAWHDAKGRLEKARKRVYLALEAFSEGSLDYRMGESQDAALRRMHREVMGYRPKGSPGYQAPRDRRERGTAPQKMVLEGVFSLSPGF